MRIENSFAIAAPAENVMAYLLDVDQVVRCIPGATLEEVVDSQTFRGTLKVKVGPIQVSYRGTAHITDIKEEEDTATLTIEGEGREIGGQGGVRASQVLTVRRAGPGGTDVSFVTEVSLSGRIAQFGRGVIEEVSRRLVGQMAECINAGVGAARAAPAP